MSDLHLLPLPRESRFGETGFDVSGPLAIRTVPEGRGPALDRLVGALEDAGARRVETADTTIELELDPERVRTAEGYELEVDERGARIHAADPAGLFYGTQTLVQLVEAERCGTGARIRDVPGFSQRGAMLDVSRDRVPTMETLFAFVELFARLKLNRLQLYTEHTFAYRGHEDVWRDADPLTPDEIRELDRFCAERFIELVPNQQSFGHMHRWLVHDRYRPLAECPDGVEHPFRRAKGGTPEPFSLCPTDPEALTLLAGLYDQLLPCFRSRTLNVGLDETFDLGTGRSAALCREKGVGRVYLEFLTEVAELVHGRGHRMQFWADIVLHHPELVAELPAGVIPMNWGYEADHPFEAETSALAATALPFHVCPGTSSWQSLGGRFANMVGNVESATFHGRASGAEGILVTDWGDRGHLQPPPASYPGWVVAADLAWNPDAPAVRRTPDGVAALLADHVLRDPSGNAGRALVHLAQAGEVVGARTPNASPLFLLLTAKSPTPAIEGLTEAGLERALDHLATVPDLLARHRMTCADAELVEHELRWVSECLVFAAERGLGRPGDPAGPIAAFPELRRARARPGGLERAREWLERARGEN